MGPMFGQPPGGMQVGPGPGAPHGNQMPQAAPGPMRGPSPDTTAMANRLYQQDQQLLMLRQEIADLRARRINMSFTFTRDEDGRLTGMDATEGMV